jgi:hypothetical protein
MKTKKSTTGLMFGLIILIGFLPLGFTFSQIGTQLILETSLKYVVWCGQVIILLTLLLKKQDFSKNQLIGLSILFVLVPFTFSFNENGVSLLILNKYTSSILSWAIASILLGKLLFTQELKENSNH